MSTGPVTGRFLRNYRSRCALCALIVLRDNTFSIFKMAASEQGTSVAQSDVSFSVGESFSSFIEFEKKLKDYERHNAVQLSR